MYPGGTGAIGAYGGGPLPDAAFSALNDDKGFIAAASSKFGVPPSVLGALLIRESSGDFAGNGLSGQSTWVDHDGDGVKTEIVPYTGILRPTAESYGISFESLIGNPQAQVDAMAQIMAYINQNNAGGDWGKSLAYYFGGSAALNGGFTDSLGMPSNVYASKAISEMNTLAAGGWGSVPAMTSPSQSGTNNPNGNRLIDMARQVQGTPYVLGATPTPGPNGAWDCSGLTWWFDQQYGDGSMPQGSGFQMQWAQQTGRLFQDTNQLQAGDVIFLNTGYSDNGTGNGASHVGLYVGDGVVISANNAQDGTKLMVLNDYLSIGTYLGSAKTGMSGGGSGGGPAGNVLPMGQPQASGPFANNYAYKYLLGAA